MALPPVTPGSLPNTMRDRQCIKPALEEARQVNAIFSGSRGLEGKNCSMVFCTNGWKLMWYNGVHWQSKKNRKAYDSVATAQHTELLACYIQDYSQRCPENYRIVLRGECELLPPFLILLLVSNHLV